MSTNNESSAFTPMSPAEFQQKTRSLEYIAADMAMDETELLAAMGISAEELEDLKTKQEKIIYIQSFREDFYPKFQFSQPEDGGKIQLLPVIGNIRKLLPPDISLWDFCVWFEFTYEHRLNYQHPIDWYKELILKIGEKDAQWALLGAVAGCLTHRSSSGIVGSLS